MNHHKSACLLFRWLRPHHFLVLMVTSVFLSFILAYTISVSLDKVHPFFPYISEAGTTVPASCYFGFCLSLASMCTGATVYYVHAFLERQLAQSCSSIHHLVNNVAFFFGLLSALGVLIVANFQVHNVLFIHMVGASMAFGIGNFCMLLYTYLTYVIIKTNGSSTTQCKFVVRIALTVVVSVGISMTVIGAIASGQTTSILWYDDTVSGYEAHLVSTFGEWIAGIAIELFFLTYLQDLKKFRTQQDNKAVAEVSSSSQLQDAVSTVEKPKTVILEATPEIFV